MLHRVIISNLDGLCRFIPLLECVLNALPEWGFLFFHDCFLPTEFLKMFHSNVGGNPILQMHDIQQADLYDVTMCGKFSSKKMNRISPRGGAMTGLPPYVSYMVFKGGDCLACL